MSLKGFDDERFELCASVKTSQSGDRSPHSKINAFLLAAQESQDHQMGPNSVTALDKVSLEIGEGANLSRFKVLRIG